MKHSALLIRHRCRFSIDEDNTGLPTLYVTVYFHEDGADALNLHGEHTTLNKEELNKLREKMNAYYPKMISSSFINYLQIKSPYFSKVN